MCARARSLINRPLEDTLAGWWTGLDQASKRAFAVAVCVSVLAFGFEMTNLTLHHDDVAQIFIQDTILGHYLGRFGLGWLHYFTQNHYFMPFLQMLEGIVLMGGYGVLVARFWGLRGTVDITLVATILCVFPYMAQVYQFNTAMATYPLAHLLVALAVTLSARATLLGVVTASMLYAAAFSIYQSVVANAATIFIVWLIGKHLFDDQSASAIARETAKATAAVLLSVVVAGLLYLAAVSMMHIEFDAYQSAEDALSLRDAMNLKLALPGIWSGTRAVLRWPETYFPEYLKALQLGFVGVAGACCLRRPNSAGARLWAATLLTLAIFAPRALQLMHPEGHYAVRTLTGYAVLIAGTVMIVNRSAVGVIRNASVVLASLLIGGYVLQCNWISTVNYLNTLAHFATTTQILACVRSIPDARWDGKTVAVVGQYDMSNDYPLTQYEAVAPRFMDAKHMERMARLMRDETNFVAADKTMPSILDYAKTHSPWPRPGSVGVVNGVGVVVLSSAP